MAKRLCAFIQSTVAQIHRNNMNFITTQNTICILDIQVSSYHTAAGAEQPVEAELRVSSGHFQYKPGMKGLHLKLPVWLHRRCLCTH